VADRSLDVHTKPSRSKQGQQICEYLMLAGERMVFNEDQRYAMKIPHRRLQNGGFCPFDVELE
jgi:hypothetical protein